MIQPNNDIEKLRDDTIDEIHLVRERIAEKHGGNLAAVISDAQQRQQASGRAIWTRDVATNATELSK
jgi:hypothetical protein